MSRTKKIAIIAGAVLLVLAAAVVILPMLIPSDVYRQRIEAEATKALGREVKVGKVGVSIFPRIEARAGASTIANPEGFGDQPFASMKELRAAVALWPLLFQKVEIDEFVLVEPNIAMVQLADGRNNWTFKVPGGEPAQPGQPTKPISASLGDVRILGGHVSYDDRKAGQVHTLSKLNLKADMQAIDKPFNVSADGLANDLAFKLNTRIENPQSMMDGLASPVTIKLDTDLIKTELDGTLALGEKPAFDFRFDGEIPSAVELADAFQVKDLPARSVLGKLSAKGQAFGDPTDITLKIEDARHESALLNADLKGEARVAQYITVALEANAEAPNLDELAKAMNIEAPAGEALGKATATTRIDGKLGDLAFSNVNFRHDSGLLKIDFAGAAKLGAALTYNGRLNIAAPDLRRLASAAGAKLPEGDIYKSFALSGDTSGSIKDVMLKNASVQFDAITAKGEAGLALGAKPRLTGALTTGDIDVTPYLTASGAPTEPEERTRGWGAEPIDRTPLRLADANLSLKTGGVRYDRFDFGPSNIAVTLADGKLTADLKQTSLFGGKGGAVFSADGSGAIPAIAMKANLDALSLKPFLQAAAGFDLMEGAGDVQIDIAGSGANLQTMMNSLVGSGDFKFDNGVMHGVNLAELGNAAKTALGTKQLPLNAFGKDAQTKFGRLNANFAMKDGVAVMANLKMDADAFTVTGGGALDIGDQKLSLSLFPEFKSKDAGLNGYGLPLKLSGGWDGVGVSMDWDFLARKAVGAAQTKVANEIQDELKKQLGSELGGLLGIGGKSQTPASAPAPAPTPAIPANPPASEPAPADSPPAQPSAEAPKSAEDRLKEEAE
ncbi:MAG TPA: AsmA family protein, partial [Hyphomonadaceae bacterium]|nr:AsmA family protein [Hyphomonadaceae bacterium]